MKVRFPASTSFLGKALRWPLALIPSHAVVRIKSGPGKGLRWKIASGVHGYWIGTYESEKVKVFASAIRPGTSVYDVGAHAGFYSLIASMCVGSAGRVIAFEPCTDNLQHLRDHVSINGLTNIDVIGTAVGAQPGRGKLELGRGSTSHRLADEGSIDIDVTTLDIVAAGDSLRPGVIKIDVEGAEVDVLRGAGRLMRTGRPVFLIATHGEELKKTCRTILEAGGYAISELDSDPQELVARPKL